MVVVSKYLHVLFLTSLLCLIGCIPRRSSSSSVALLSLHDVSIHITMPKNVIAFEHVAPLIYEALYHRFEAAGYQVRAGREGSTYALTARVVHFDRPDQFVSPDLIPYVFRVRLELECDLYRGETILHRKRFACARWIKRPDDPVLNDSFLTYQYRELLRQSMPRIDYYFRTIIATQQSDIS